MKRLGYYNNTFTWFTVDNGPEVNCGVIGGGTGVIGVGQGGGTGGSRVPRDAAAGTLSLFSFTSSSQVLPFLTSTPSPAVKVLHPVLSSAPSQCKFILNKSLKSADMAHGNVNSIEECCGACIQTKGCGTIDIPLYLF